tara:strand:+ start:370 stop:528 length:159 start_codon:yes stop_codon:yes gene_type:complete
MNIHELTSAKVSGFGRQKEPPEIYRGAENAITFIPKIKIEVGALMQKPEPIS